MKGPIAALQTNSIFSVIKNRTAHMIVRNDAFLAHEIDEPICR
jgi:hypothetical protein